jgi:hypothetical protein
MTMTMTFQAAMTVQLEHRKLQHQHREPNSEQMCKSDTFDHIIDDFRTCRMQAVSHR